jgi:hypothetical protein
MPKDASKSKSRREKSRELSLPPVIAASSSQSIGLDPNSIFAGLFKHEPHAIHWYVYRSPGIRKTLHGLWGKGPEKKDSLLGATIEQRASTHANALFHMMERGGPSPEEWFKSIALDSKHGYCHRPKENCHSKGFYHTHLTDGKKCTYVILWEAFEEQKVINIIDIAPHEDFDYVRRHHSPLSAMLEAISAAKEAGFLPEISCDPSQCKISIKPS